MSIQDYYENYWLNNLPKDIKFFSGHPTLQDAKDNFAYLDRFCKIRDNILDYGCGEGYLVEMMNHYYYPVGVDISHTAIKYARSKFHGLTFKHASEEHKGKFDVIVSFEVLEHVFDFDELFAYFDKYLVKKGKLILSTNEMCLAKMIYIGLRHMDDFFHPYSPHIRFFTKKSLIKLLESKGYRILHWQRMGNYFGFLSKGQRVVAEKI